MDLSKTYHCLPHYLLLAKLQANSFSKESIRLFLGYQMKRVQIIKIGSTFIDWINILKGIAQGSLTFLSIICSFSQQNMISVTLLTTIAFILVVRI